MKRALVIGASSGIGRALSLELAAAGWDVTVSARRSDLLEELAAAAPARIHPVTIDITQADAARNHVFAAAAAGRLDLVVVNAGVSTRSGAFAWEADRNVIATNVDGFAACAHAAMEVFIQQKQGHLIGISSVAGQISLARSAPYNASKAFVSNYLRGLRLRFMQRGVPVYVTDVRPGFIDTPMTEGLKGKFWSITAEDAAKRLMDTIRHPKKVTYLPRRWALIAAIARRLPDSVLYKVF